MENEIITYIKERLEFYKDLASTSTGFTRDYSEVIQIELKFILARFDNDNKEA